MPHAELQALVYDILPSTTAVFSYAVGPRKLSANKHFFVGAQTVVSLLQTTQIISDVCFITDHVAYASSYETKIFSIETNFFLTRGGCISCLCACLAARLLPQSYQYPNLLEGADCVGGQLCGDKECPFSGVTKSCTVWRKVLESNARSVAPCMHHSLIYLPYFPLKDDMQSCTSTPAFIPSTCSLKIHHASENVTHGQQTLCFDQFMCRFKLSNELLRVCRVKQHCKSILWGYEDFYRGIAGADRVLTMLLK